MLCESHCREMDRDGYCDCCRLYNAAVAAQQAAARALARAKAPGSTGAWLNEYGVFAWVDGVARQIGSKDEAAPFAALTGAALRAKDFMPLVKRKRKAKRDG